MTYLLISIPFLLAAGALWAWRRRSAPRQLAVTSIVLAVLLLLTTIFDNFMILAGLVGYADAQMSGLYIGVMPVEDLLYAIVAAIAVPALWTGHAREGAGERGRE
ncbi:lycopene cyclase domain-containing protein [Corynebacterium xerosis]|uniref:lycopene cyclase domain-containing protein n=1 Tax=Corynebacterium xerosis TaxID=1725 RepID=UPI0027BAA3D2|nr:lycopene cyclase domain-containing protein [Corynebacterium xerosis]